MFPTLAKVQFLCSPKNSEDSKNNHSLLNTLYFKGKMFQSNRVDGILVHTQICILVWWIVGSIELWALDLDLPGQDVWFLFTFFSTNLSLDIPAKVYLDIYRLVNHRDVARLAFFHYPQIFTFAGCGLMLWELAARHLGEKSATKPANIAKFFARLAMTECSLIWKPWLPYFCSLMSILNYW